MPEILEALKMFDKVVGPRLCEMKCCVGSSQIKLMREGLLHVGLLFLSCSVTLPTSAKWCGKARGKGAPKRLLGIFRGNITAPKTCLAKLTNVALVDEARAWAVCVKWTRGVSGRLREGCSLAAVCGLG